MSPFLGFIASAPWELTHVLTDFFVLPFIKPVLYCNRDNDVFCGKQNAYESLAWNKDYKNVVSSNCNIIHGAGAKQMDR